MWWQFIGGESFPVNGTTQHYDILINHIKRLRMIEGMEQAMVVIAPESNLANEAMHHEYFIKKAGLINVCIMREDRDNKPGIRIDNGIKRTMAMQFNQVLSGNMVYFHEKFVTIKSKSLSNKNPADTIIDEAINQFQCYNRVIKPPNDVNGKAKEMYTGKSGGGRDDLVIGAQINYYVKMLFFMHHEKYQEYYN